jgi:predicted phage terminase large subunit-like protein
MKLTTEEERQKATIEFARNSLAAYARTLWPTFERPKHVEYLVKVLHEIESGKRDRVIVTMPPRHGKSNLCSQFFPAWYLGRNPDHYVIASSYAQNLADDFGRKVRNFLADPTHATIFPECQIAGDSASVQRFATSQGGQYFAVGRGGSITGRGGHLIIIDDPIKDREEANSERIRKQLHDWFSSVVYTRLMVGGKIIVIQTRWHEDDLAGWLLREHADDGWEVFNLPAIAEHDEGWRAEGEALWPERYPLSRPKGDKGMSLQRIRKAIGPWDFTSLYQQRTVAADGEVFKAHWFDSHQYNNIEPNSLNKYILVDPANSKKKRSDYTAMMVIGLGEDRNVYVLDILRDKLSLTERAEALFRLHKKWKTVRAVIYEQYGAQADGTYLREKMDLLNYRFHLQEVSGHLSKEERVRRLVPYFESGRVLFPRSCWYHTVYEERDYDLVKVFRNEEFLTFPSGLHDDMLDALSRFLDDKVHLDWPAPLDETGDNDYDSEDDTWMSA